MADIFASSGHNHECKAEFCYLCGEPAHRHSDHWTVGQPCPRFGRPGNPNAIHDNPTDISAFRAAFRLAIVRDAIRINTLNRTIHLASAHLTLATTSDQRRQLLLANGLIYMNPQRGDLLLRGWQRHELHSVRRAGERMRELEALITRETFALFPHLRGILQEFLEGWEGDLVIMVA